MKHILKDTIIVLILLMIILCVFNQKINNCKTENIVETEISDSYNTDYSEEAIVLAKIVYGESRGIKSTTEQACVVWTVLNRVDYYGKSILETALMPNQFCYRENAPTVDDYGRDLVALVEDVLERWKLEKAGETNVGRVLPNDYFWYHGDGKHNYFRNTYHNPDKKYWDYTLDSPYDN